MSSASHDGKPIHVTANDPAEFRSFDDNFESSQIDRHNSPDPTGRTFHYAMAGTARMFYATAARLMVVKLVATMAASADVLALSKVEADISKIPLGQAVTIKWRGKPVFIRHRTPEEISLALQDDNAPDLRDKQKDADRVQKPEWLIVIGICTHLGCIPIGGLGNYKGWFCPCHGSHYDTSGRIRMGPAPLNLEVPTYQFVSDTKIVIG